MSCQRLLNACRHEVVYVRDLMNQNAMFNVCINSLGEIGQISGKILYKLIPSLSDPNGSCESPKKVRADQR